MTQNATDVQPGPRRFLVEFVNTLADPVVFDQLYRLSLEAPTEFHLVMPILKPNYGLTWTGAQARTDAEDRLAIILESMQRAGMVATGEVVTDPPPVAIANVARGSNGPFDRILAIWREKKYRWLYGGERKQLERDLGVPVESIRANPLVPHSNVEDPEHLRALFEDYATKKGWIVA